MVVKRRSAILLSGTLLVASLLAWAPAQADDAQSEQLQDEINAMQHRLQKLQDQMAETKKEAKSAQQAVQNFPGGVLRCRGKACRHWRLQGTAFAAAWRQSYFGGFIEAAGIWRERNEVADSGIRRLALPFPNSPLYHENEFSLSGRQSRLAVRATGDIDPAQHLEAYYEMDFLGAGVTANSRESNSYQPRIRQAFLSYDNDNSHFHLMAGQSWSLVTQDREGMLPLAENLPLVIDSQYAVGFNWARQPQIRFVEDFNQKVWLGVSIESPAGQFCLE